MRTVGHHIGHIGSHRPVDQPMGVVIERAGGPELPDLRQIGPHMHQFHATNDRKAFRVRLAGGNGADQFDGLEAVVVEEPLMRFGPAAFQACSGTGPALPIAAS